MSGPVAVLAVLERLRLCAIRGCGCNEVHAAEILETRAAVAELIELSRVIDAEFRSDPMAVQCFDLGVLRRWQSALNNVGGMQ